MTVYIASRVENGGILRCSLSDEGQLKPVEMTPVDRPSYLCRDGDKLYALLREPFQLMSGLNIYTIETGGSLYLTGETRSTHGLYSAHLYARSGNIWIANYIDGTVALLKDTEDTTPVQDRMIAFSGSGPNRFRQLSSHPHCVVPTPDGLYFCVCDLGTDQIYTITPELDFVSACALPGGCGPRHLVFSPDGRFAFSSNEMGSSVSAMAYRDGELKHLKTVSSLPPEYNGSNTASAIMLSKDGTRLVVSNRGLGGISVFQVSGPNLYLEGYIPSFGVSPREIALAGDYLIVGNELSDNVTAFCLKNGIPDAPVCDLKVKMPWSILVI